MTLLIASTLLSLVVLPLLALFWLTRTSASLIHWSVKAIAVGGYVLSTYYLGSWQMLSYYGRYGLALLVLAATLYGVWQMRGAPLWERPTGWQWVGLLGALVLAGLSGLALVAVQEAKEVPPNPVELSFPLRNGAFYVASGGSQELMNPHMKVTAPKFEAWRGQRWALDIVELYPSGNRARGLYPTDLDQFAVFDAPVYAPCEGRVDAAEDQFSDLTPPNRDTTHRAGNYVVLQCGPEAFVLLAHLKQGSITRAAGDTVEMGTVLGTVGNSGNSWEPHLHISAQRATGEATVLDAAPRPMTFDGAFPVRNDVIRNTPQ